MISSAQFNSLLHRKAVQSVLKMELIENGELPYKDFVDKLYKDLDSAIFQLQKNPELHQTSSEDLLSLWLLDNLNTRGYDAVHEGKTGGHVDLTIKLGDYSWIGEAKKDGNYEGGFKQLNTRYVTASGNFSHDSGGLIFYLVKRKNAKQILDKWKDKLEGKNIVCTYCSNNNLAFYSDHVLDGSGTDFFVRSMAVSLYHKPQDASGVKTAGKKVPAKATAAKKPAAKKPAAKKPAATKAVPTPP